MTSHSSRNIANHHIKQPVTAIPAIISAGAVSTWTCSLSDTTNGGTPPPLARVLQNDLQERPKKISDFAKRSQF
jgi:hypothetical protein